MNVTQKREFLKKNGWMRTSRAAGPHENVEYWIDPKTDAHGFSQQLSLNAATKKQLKRDRDGGLPYAGSDHYLHRAYRAGFQACLNEDNHCPHAVASAEWSWWHDGFNEAAAREGGA